MPSVPPHPPPHTSAHAMGSPELLLGQGASDKSGEGFGLGLSLCPALGMQDRIQDARCSSRRF